MTDAADIVQRLLKVEPDTPGERTRWYRNPDGPEAAAEITRLRAEVEALRVKKHNECKCHPASGWLPCARCPDGAGLGEVG